MPYAMKDCPECGKSFEPNSSTQTYCSRACAYQRFKAGGRYEEMKREKREAAERLRSYQFSGCPYALGEIRMPDGGRIPCPGLGF